MAPAIDINALKVTQAALSEQSAFGSAILESAGAPREIASQILQVHRWSTSYQVKRAIVCGAATPHPISLALISAMNPGDLKDLAASDDVPLLISAVARRILG